MGKVEKRRMDWGKHKEVKLVHEVKMEHYAVCTAVQVRTLICGWLARLLRMSRPGKTESNAEQGDVKRQLILGALRCRESRSLMANVLNESDLHLRYRPSRTQPNSPPMNNEPRPRTSATGIAVFWLEMWTCFETNVFLNKTWFLVLKQHNKTRFY